jgi:hypothetical protein
MEKHVYGRKRQSCFKKTKNEIDKKTKIIALEYQGLKWRNRKS